MVNESERLTPAEMLSEVDNAIYSIMVGGQSYKIGSRQLNRADLKTLYGIKNDLTAQVTTGSGNLLGDCYVAEFDRR